jgi:hypothetical protein
MWPKFVLYVSKNNKTQIEHSNENKNPCLYSLEIEWLGIK